MVDKITNPPSQKDLIDKVNELVDDKQDTISDLETIRSGAALGATAVQPSDLATVATSGSYTDLSNKPTIPTVPTNVSAFTNDAGYITSSALTGYATESYVTTAVSGKQDTLVSGTNIKTINNTSILGSGNIDIQGGGGSYTAGTGIDITNNVISVTSPTLVNTATGTNSLTIFSSNICTYRGGINIGPSATSLDWGTALGLNSYSENQGVSIGYNSKARGTNSIAIGGTAQIGIGGINYAIQLGYGTNSEANSFYVGTSSSDNWKMLGSDGKIPSGRLPIATSVSSSSTNDETVGAKLFYDTVGDIETILHNINSGS